MLYSKKEDLLEEKENLNYIILDKRTDKKYEEKKVLKKRIKECLEYALAFNFENVSSADIKRIFWAKYKEVIK